MHPGPGNDVFEIEIEQVVTFHNVRVELRDLLAQGPEHLLFTHLVAKQDFCMAAIIHQSNREDAVLLSLGI